MLDLLSIGTNRGHSMIGVGISAGLTGAKRARSIQDPLPALDLDWATDRSLPAAYGPTPSFSRASTGTFFNSSGTLTTAAVNAPRFDHVYDGTNWVSKGLLIEEQRTNVCPYSDYPSSGWQIYPSGTLNFTPNFTTAPDGTATAARIYPNISGLSRTIYQGTAANNTTSVYAKFNGIAWIAFYDTAGSGPSIWFNVQTGTVGTATGYTAKIENVGNGWYRCSATASTGTWAYHYVSLVDADGIQTVTASGTNGAFIWGAQSETGAFPTSYIPTPSTTAVTRSADVCQITGTDFTSFWNASEGSVAVEFDQLADASKMTNESYIYGFQNAADAEQFILRGQSSGVYYWRSVNSGNVDATAQISSLGTSTVKHAACYKVNDFASTFNGAAVVSDTSGATPIPTTLGIGFNWPSGGNRINGHIARLRYYPTRLTNAKLQELST